MPIKIQRFKREQKIRVSMEGDTSRVLYLRDIGRDHVKVIYTSNGFKNKRHVVCKVMRFSLLDLSGLKNTCTPPPFFLHLDAYFPLDK